MRNLFLTLLILLLSVSSAAAHGGISKLPDSVQIMQYKMLLYMDENDISTKNSLAMAYFRTNELNEATQQLEEVLKLDANNFDALDGMGIVLLRQKKSAEAVKYLDRALALNEKDMMLHVHLSLAHQQLNQPELAQKSLETAEALAATPEAADEIQQEIQLLSNS
ncbi:MAG: tetratricopeptide repeat protein [Candidatus Electrothrix aestuarii]|uniref:Tetratricopeptide repeat protein n=1 Tax=Candidatus Electrothrix aestuarii TaxID=3062594 RepID=A0AAU8LXJ8_9BACT|nr:tetratricopeptide repeat protein [Candidatus Electrothrix aestuarii]WPD22559.1 MAG: tetratricopeptide repeat protein [Candidatus Electrothrix sp. GW3-3]